MAFLKKPGTDADKLQASLTAVAAAHDALGAAYEKLLDNLGSLDGLGIAAGTVDSVEHAMQSLASDSRLAGRGVREIEFARVIAIQNMLKAQRTRVDKLRDAYAKATDPKKKRAANSEEPSRDELDQAEAELENSRARADVYVAAVTQVSLRELAHVEATYHARCLEQSSAALSAIPVPRVE
jgi:hypothetical protein